MMDRYPKAGIIQTSTTTVNCDSLFGRVQQFASRAYGPVLTAGLRFWQLGESYYWGHNAIIRVAPFVKNCGLRRLPGKAPLGGEILSHDFVEAALMGRAGYEVWVVQDVPGSYEETPPTLADELKRDRRWCQGNLQHMRLLLADRLRFGHRAIFFTGIMSYASGLLWLVFLILNTMEIAAQAYLPLIYFSSEPSLFPIWPQWHPEWAIALLTTTAVLLFLPKLLSLLIIVRRRETHLFGGFIALSTSILVEMAVSTILAPIRMWFHSKFVIVTLMGRQIKWGPQFRTDNETRWRDAIRLHGVATLLAAAWMSGMLWINPAASVWLVPVVFSLMISIPVSVLSSRVSLGRALRRWGLFLIPEEVSPPSIIRYLQGEVQKLKSRAKSDAFVCAAVQAYANHLHLKLTRRRGPKSAEARKQNQSLVKDALNAGPAILSAADKAKLLRDAASMASLHRSIWRIRDPNIAGQWGLGDMQ
jgi:membrane glycosyltransferase